MKKNIDVYCVCWNEIKILPFVIDYWKKFARKVYVYDNGSTDGTIELLQQYDWIEVRNFVTEGMDDAVHIQIKNNEWKGSDADYVVVCDLDECLYSDDWDYICHEILDCEAVNVIRPTWYDVISDEFPIYENDKLLHEISNKGVKNPGPKVIMFNPKIENINYTIGCHECNPSGDVYIVHPQHLYTMHLKKLSPEYESERRKILAERLSPTNKAYGWGYHYNYSDINILKEEYKNLPVVDLRDELGL